MPTHSLYFKTLKFLSIQFLILSVLNLPALVAFGEASREGHGCKGAIPALTLCPLLKPIGIQWGGLDDQGDVLTFLSWWDFAVLVFFFGSTLWLARRQCKDLDLLNETKTTISVRDPETSCPRSWPKVCRVRRTTVYRLRVCP